MGLEHTGLMGMLYDIKNAISKGFSVEDKDCFKRVYDLLKSKGQDTTRFEEKLKTLRLIKTTEEEYGSGYGAHYNEKNNEIVYTDEKYLYHETFHVATKGITFKEVNSDLTETIMGDSLNEGITDLFTKKINEETHTEYRFERACADLLEKAYGEEIFNPYFEGSYKNFVNQFGENKDIVINLITDLDKYTYVNNRYSIYLIGKVGKIENEENEENNGYKKQQKYIGHELREQIADAFYKVTDDLITLFREDSRVSLPEIGKYFEEKLSDPELSVIIDTVELGSNQSVKVDKMFKSKHI